MSVGSFFGKHEKSEGKHVSMPAGPSSIGRNIRNIAFMTAALVGSHFSAASPEAPKTQAPKTSLQQESFEKSEGTSSVYAILEKAKELLSAIPLDPPPLPSAHAGIPREEVAEDEMDLIEVNHFHDDNGRLVFSQVIFYEWAQVDPSKGGGWRYQVRAWRMLKVTAQIPRRDHTNGGYVTIWHDTQNGDVMRKVKAQCFRETFTQYDPELIEREFLAKDKRRDLRRIPETLASMQAIKKKFNIVTEVVFDVDRPNIAPELPMPPNVNPPMFPAPPPAPAPLLNAPVPVAEQLPAMGM